MARKHGAYKSVTGKGYFVVGYKVGMGDLPAIRELLPCWRSSKLPQFVKLAPPDYENQVKKQTPPEFACSYLAKIKHYLVHGMPATAEEIAREFPEGIGDQDHVIKLAISY